MGDPLILRLLLGNATDPLGVKDLRGFHFDDTVNDDFFAKMLETFFQIWDEHTGANLGDMPSLLIRHFLQKYHSPECLKKFPMPAPEKVRDQDIREFIDRCRQ